MKIILYSFILIIFNYYLIIYIGRKIKIISTISNYISSFGILFNRKEFIKASTLDKISINGIKLLISLILILVPYFCFYLLLTTKFKMSLIYSLLIPSFSYLPFLLKEKH